MTGNFLQETTDGSFTDADGGETRYVYDGLGRMTEWYDAAGARQVSNSYDELGRVIAQTDANGGEYAVEYYDDHTVTVDAEGNRSEIWFDAQKRTTRTVDASGAAVTYDYDQNSNIIAITDALGNTTRYEYDAAGNKTKETAPDGSSYSLRYDANNKLTQLTDQRGNVTRYEYDALRQLVKTTYPDGSAESRAYDQAGNVISMTDVNGGTVTAQYDASGRLISQTLADGTELRHTYDACGRMVSAESDGKTVLYTYDALGNITSITDADGGVTRYSYDSMNRLLSETAPDGGVTSYTYNLAGNALTMTDALGNVTHYEYDCLGNMLAAYYADGGEKHYEYDAQNRVSAITDTDGTVTRYRYDLWGNASIVPAPETPAEASPHPTAVRPAPAYEPATLGRHTEAGYKPAPLAAKTSTSLGSRIKNGLSNIGNTLKSWGTSISNTVKSVGTSISNAVKGIFTGGKSSQPQTQQQLLPWIPPVTFGTGGGNAPVPVTQSPINVSWGPAPYIPLEIPPAVTSRIASACAGQRNKNSGLTVLEALKYGVANVSPATVTLAGEVAVLDSPALGPADIGALVILAIGVGSIAHEVYNNGIPAAPTLTLEPSKPPVIADPLPEAKKPDIETFPGTDELPDINALPEPLPEEEGLHTTAPMIPEEDSGNILTAEDEGVGEEKPSTKPYGSNSKANEQARKQGYNDAHDFKEDYVGKSNVSKFDMKYDTKTGEIYLESKDGSIQIPTGLYHIP